jgi:hypothetical protein
VALVRDGEHTVLTMGSDFQGDPKDFAIVIPVPTAIEKFTWLTGATCCSLITLVILVRCSVDSFAPAPAWPTV